ncbi:MAG: hypothetical protein GY702_02885 [Desulfobulbaceae bacterium]|nr:hypothetical protein [Desulfobulbaceae bacterium]
MKTGKAKSSSRNLKNNSENMERTIRKCHRLHDDEVVLFFSTVVKRIKKRLSWNSSTSTELQSKCMKGSLMANPVKGR